MPIIMAILGAPLWFLLRDRCAVARALTAGARIPGTDTIVQQVSQCRFSGIGTFFMAVVSSWIFLRVICKDLPFWREMHQQGCLDDSSDSETEDDEVERRRLHEHYQIDMSNFTSQWDTKKLWATARNYQPLEPFTQSELDDMLVDNYSALNADAETTQEQQEAETQWQTECDSQEGDPYYKYDYCREQEQAQAAQEYDQEDELQVAQEYDADSQLQVAEKYDYDIHLQQHL